MALGLVTCECCGDVWDELARTHNFSASRPADEFTTVLSNGT
jgi:hypothetical protein